VIFKVQKQPLDGRSLAQTNIQDCKTCQFDIGLIRVKEDGTLPYFHTEVCACLDELFSGE
jgi:hypothetical protein